MSAIRWLLVALTVVLVLVHVASLAEGIVRWDFGESGYSYMWPSLEITAVRHGYPAERAGLQPGDTIDLVHMPLHDRLTFVGYQVARVGEVQNLVVVRDGVSHTFRLTYRATDKDPRLVTFMVFEALTAMLVGALTIFVLMRSPSIEAFALWGLAVTTIEPGGNEFGYLAPDWLAAFYGGFVTDVFIAALTIGMVVLALRATGRWSRRERYEIGAVVLGLSIYVVAEYSDVLTLSFGRAPSAILAQFASLPGIESAVIVAIIVAISFLKARGPARIRLRWVTIGFSALVFEYLFATVIGRIPALSFALWPSFVNLFLINAGFATLGYAIVRRDLFDVGFVINRAAIYTTLTALLVGAFAGLNWSIGVLLKQTGLALPIDVILAAAVGLSLNLIQRRVDRNVDRIFFRHRYDAEIRLRRVARALTHVSEDAGIAQALVSEPVQALALYSAAFYRRSAGGSYELVDAHGWPDGSPREIAASDPFVLHLFGASEALRLETVPHDAAFPHGSPRPRIAFPMWSRRELIAFALYSTHTNGAMLDPDEVELVERIVAAATVAIERVAAISLHERFTALKAEFDAMKAQRDEFLTIIATPQGMQRAIASD
jgi:hypothetical protein